MCSSNPQPDSLLRLRAGLIFGLLILGVGILSGTIHWPQIAREYQHALGWFGILVAAGTAPPWLTNLFLAARKHPYLTTLLCLVAFACFGYFCLAHHAVASQVALCVFALFIVLAAGATTIAAHPKATPKGAETLFGAIVAVLIAVESWEFYLKPFNLVAWRWYHPAAPWNFQWYKIFVSMVAVILGIVVLRFLIAPTRMKTALYVWREALLWLATGFLFFSTLAILIVGAINRSRSQVLISYAFLVGTVILMLILRRLKGRMRVTCAGG